VRSNGPISMNNDSRTLNQIPEEDQELDRDDLNDRLTYQAD